MSIATNITDIKEEDQAQVREMRPLQRSSPSALEYEKAKRVFDVVISFLLLIVSAPLMVLIALAVKMTSPGPVIFRQIRVGKFGEEFWFYKFRSMTTDAGVVRATLADRNQHGQESITFKIKNDPRITKVGRLIRKTSLDELPQLWNVLIGNMSLVGPRPALPGEVERYTEEQRLRLAVTPGLTCLWQIRGRADLSFEQQVQLDLEYIERRSFWLDLCLIVLTFPALITGRGAY